MLRPYASFMTRDVILSKSTFSFMPFRLMTYILSGESTGSSSFRIDAGVVGAAEDIYRQQRGGGRAYDKRIGHRIVPVGREAEGSGIRGQWVVMGLKERRVRTRSERTTIKRVIFF